ncbi:MAG: hypothetical protein JXA07_09795 [Spirochaetes bacterium]|nr:hypothetical protein [Spirochaetota bacterium]
MNFTPVETRVLDRIQKDFPVSMTPFRDMAESLGIAEREFLDTIRNLKQAGILRSIAGIFNADRLGYVSCLVAFSVNEADLESAAAAINSHPGVSHNYLRENPFNMWFTIASESKSKLLAAIGRLAAICEASDHMVLFNEKMIKIGLMLPVGDDGPSGKPSSLTADASSRSEKHNLEDIPAAKFTDEDREAIRLLQIDLPLEENAFASLIESSGSAIDTKTLISCMARFKANNILRRYSGVLRHRKAGYRSNAMTVWRPEDSADMRRISDIFAGERSISHLYLRTVYPGKWEYPLYAMIHARNEDDLNAIIEKLSRESGIADYRILRTIREFKKERVIYFSEKFKEWELSSGL